MPTKIDHGHALVPSVREDCAEGGPQTGRDFQVKGKILRSSADRGNACDTSPREKVECDNSSDVIPEMECEPIVGRIHPRTNRGHLFRITIGNGDHCKPSLPEKAVEHVHAVQDKRQCPEHINGWRLGSNRHYLP